MLVLPPDIVSVQFKNGELYRVVRVLCGSHANEPVHMHYGQAELNVLCSWQLV
jgi:hypothetical protein